MKRTGIILGKFYPLHLGHINMMLEALLQVDELHIFICSDTMRDEELYQNSQFTIKPTIEERLKWASTIFADIPNIYIHHLNEDGITAYPNGWEEWTQRTLDLIHSLNITPTIIFSSEPQDKIFYEELFNLPVELMDPDRKKFPVSATKIRTETYQYWQFLPRNIRPFFTQRILLSPQPATIQAGKLLSTIYNAPLISIEDHLQTPIQVSIQPYEEKLLFIQSNEKTQIPKSALQNVQAIICTEKNSEITNSTLPHFTISQAKKLSAYHYQEMKTFIDSLLKP